MPWRGLASVVILLITFPAPASSQRSSSEDPVIRQIWAEGMTDRSQVAPLAEALLDSIGPRLVGTTGFDAAVEWLTATYRRLDIPVRREQYGTWRGWQRGPLIAELVTPRAAQLNARLLGWSRGTDGPVEGEVVIFPDLETASAMREWITTAAGKFVLYSAPYRSCRPSENLERLALPETARRMLAQRTADTAAWRARVRRWGDAAVQAMEAAGAAGLLTMRWTGGWGVNRIGGAETDRIPALDLSCEDYGLLYRLAERGVRPRIRIDAQAEVLGERPVFNVIAELRGSEKPEEYVILSAHLDSWHPASGATDNGTGTVMMLEAMRLLSLAYPRPKRTILAGHWGGEEVGLQGSRAFAEDHPEVVRGIHVLFNQDNGTWRVDTVRTQGFAEAPAFFRRWFSRLPDQLTTGVSVDSVSPPDANSDHLSFLCSGVPAFRLQSNYPDYREHTWHTVADTYDKIILEDLRRNATLAAMLAYLAAEDAEPMPRARKALTTAAGEPFRWPTCAVAKRSTG